MIVGGYPDLLGYTRRNRTTSDIKARMNVTSQEAVTGIQADLTKATNGRVGNAHLMQKALNDIEQETRINSVSASRLELTMQGISGVQKAVTGIDTKAILALASGSAPGVETVQNEAEANLRNTMYALGLKQGSRNLFSGNATDKPPYADPDILLEDIRNIMSTAGSPSDIETALDTYFNDPAGGFATKIYLGGTEAASPLRLANDDKINVDIRGDNQTLKDLLRGLATIATADSSGFAIDSVEFSQVFSAGSSFTGNAATNLIVMEGQLGIHTQAINQANARNADEKLALQTAYQSLVGRDEYEAAAELKLLETQLQSSYVITSRMSDLSLTNYLR